MRPFFRGCVVAVGGFALLAAAVSDTIADEPSTDSTIRAVQASHSGDEPPAPTMMLTQPAAPATASFGTPAPAPSATPAEPKLPVAPLPFRRSNSSTLLTRSMPEPPVTNQARQALGFYGGNPARATLNQFPRRTPIQPGLRRSMRQQIKPFQTAQRDPTVSPYLNLYREENDTESAPNYYAFVRPQFEQIEANRVQQSEIQQLTRQLNRSSGTVASPQYRAAGMPGTGTPARYMDTAQFYGGWR